MDGQAESGPESVDDLAQFLVDNPEADAKDEATERREPSRKADNSDADENPDDESGAGPAEDPDDEDAEGDHDEESDDADKRPSLKFKVPVKGEDGADTTIEVDEKELIAGYQRHADYTRKTMEMANQSREAAQVVTKQLEEGRSYYLHQAQMAHTLVRTLAGLRSPQEMAALAQTDPSQYVQETARERAINDVLAQIEQGMHHETQQGEQQTQQQMQQEFQRAWGVLGQQGIDKPKLQKIFEGIAKEYSVPKERFAKVSDPALVLIMRDAMAYRELKTKAATVKPKSGDAPRLPAARQAVPEREKVSKTVAARFKSGRAKVDDLAAFLLTHKH
ncbi:hypothetical protein [Variovorax sp. PBL-E5]|uniref:hypothetical protein n=1 Tax=Variovorax sp. PBL-E5 TaxID=434014 RepID=UPI00131947EC|nr:hypothetical protein [Variovorax sp. PBL-E5]VTU37038.1 hypothetical protein E5CHR_04468 [Variovorax sp. PBL-E5]